MKIRRVRITVSLEGRLQFDTRRVQSSAKVSHAGKGTAVLRLTPIPCLNFACLLRSVFPAEDVPFIVSEQRLGSSFPVFVANLDNFTKIVQPWIANRTSR